MRSVNLGSSSGLFPSGVSELQLHCVDRDLFCWISGGPTGPERLLGLPIEWDEAQRELAGTLEREHGFTASNASSAVGTLFDRASEAPQPKPEASADGRIPVTGYVLPRGIPAAAGSRT